MAYLFLSFLQSGFRAWGNLGRSIMGTILGMGCQGEWRIIDRDLECHSSSPLVRSSQIRGIASIAIFGNVVTAWSWFGTNMLGVGLHSYGFMDKAFNPLMWFIALQLGLIAVVYFIPYFDLLQANSRERPKAI